VAGSNSGSNNGGGNCTANFSCGGNIAVCYFRTFEHGRSGVFQVVNGRSQRYRGFHRGDGYCMNARGTPAPDCIRAPIKFESCN
jgi:hypothetical protein